MKKIFTLIFICCYFFAEADYWTQKADFGGNEIKVAVSFSFDVLNKGYICTGDWQALVPDSKELWEYDKVTDSWTQKADFPGVARRYAVSFSFGYYGYVGLGSNALNSVFYNDFWQYNALTNTWLQRANYTGSSRLKAVGFAIGFEGFVCTGQDANTNYTQELYKYDFFTDSWLLKTPFPGTARTAAVGFVINNLAYIGTGINTGTLFSDFWKYDPVADSWAQIPDLTGQPRSAASTFAINNKGYICTGYSSLGLLNDLYEYNASLNSWTQKSSLPAPIRSLATGFAIGTKGYIGTGTGGTIFYKDFWEYTTDSTTAIEEIPNNNFQFTISPNPAKEFIVISSEFREKKKIEIRITDINGKEILFKQNQTKSNNFSQTKIDVSNFSNGIYFVAVGDSRQKAVKKFLKE